jgi:hypothetical protein
LIILASVALLCACSSTAPQPLSTTAAQPAAAPSSAAWRPTPTQRAAFLRAFRAAYPDLASGRTSTAIAHDADSTCFALAQDEEQAVILKRLSARFERNGITPDAKMSASILTLVRRTACPAA